jgi:hypothetical protein
MRELQSLGFDPTKRLQVFEEIIVLRKFGRQLDRIIVASLRCPSNSLKKTCKFDE